MSEDRTQAPTPRRRQQARERGLVARSPELTAGAGLLAGVVLLGVFGDDLATTAIGLIQVSLTAGDPLRLDDPGRVAEHLRSTAFGVLGPVLGIVFGVVATMLIVHQLQVGGLWAPGLLAPDPARLASGFGSADAANAVVRCAWAMVKALAVAGVVLGMCWQEAPSFQRLAGLDPAGLAGLAGAIVLNLARALAGVAVVLGAIDFLLAWQRVEVLLRQTPDEYREDLKALDGDPALRARRRALAQSLRRDPAAVVPGATLGLLGPGGLIVVLAGGPPPGRVTVRQVARGVAAASLRRAAERTGLPLIEAAALASHLAQGPAAASALPPRLAEQLARLWPGPDQ